MNIVNDDGSAVVPDETPTPAQPRLKMRRQRRHQHRMTAPVPDDIPAVVNHAPVAQIASPIGAVEAGAQVS